MRNLSIASLLYNPIKRQRDADISHQRDLKYTVYEDTYPSLGAFTGGIEPDIESPEQSEPECDECEQLYKEHEITWWDSLCAIM